MSKCKKSDGYPRAVVREVKGQMVLDDPDAVGKENCKNTLKMNADRVEHFKRRISERGMTADQVVIVVIKVDDVHGGPLADALMPGYNWQEIRDRGEVPFARGLAVRKGILGALDLFDKEASEKLRGTKGVAVVVIDYGTAEVFPV